MVVCLTAMFLGLPESGGVPTAMFLCLPESGGVPYCNVPVPD